MNDEQKIFRVSLVVALIGLPLLLFMSEKLEPEYSKIANITNKNLDQFVKIQGEITKIRDLEDILILEIRDETDQITVTTFKKGKINLTQGQRIEVEGKVIRYKNEMEIQSSLIKII